MTDYEKGYADGVAAAAKEAESIHGLVNAHTVGTAIAKRIRALAAPAAPKEET